jgi:hypothetical protein
MEKAAKLIWLKQQVSHFKLSYWTPKFLVDIENMLKM